MGNIRKQESDKNAIMTPEKTPWKIRKQALIDEIKDTLRLIGPWSVNCLELSKKHECDWETAKRIYNNLLLSIKPENIAEFKLKAEHTLTKNLEYCEKIRADRRLSEHARMKAMSLANDTVDKLTKFLQEIGKLEKPKDRLEHSGELQITNIFAKFKELKNEPTDKRDK